MYINNEYIEVIINKKRIKNIYFHINDEGKLIVNTPIFTTNHEISKLLDDNYKSIENMYNKYKIKAKHKEEIRYLGKEYTFVKNNKIIFEDNIAYGPSIEAINTYLEKNSKAIFSKRLELYINDFEKVPYFRLRTRKMRTRWGVNNRKSETITLNTELIHYDYTCIDYVIVHELSHFEHMDHSRAFWECVSRHYPNYKIARKELKY